MKNYFRTYFLIVFLFAFSCDNSSNKKETKSENTASSSMTSSSESPIMSFDKTLHDFGTIQEGETVETIFTFTNSGKSDLIIVDARGSCGCTVPEYLKILLFLLAKVVKLELVLIQVTNQTCSKNGYYIS